MPKLIIVAGCNGAGKSKYALSFLVKKSSSFDYDKLFLKNYSSLPDSEFREEFATNKTTQQFEEAIAFALEQNTDFCYETNFDHNPIYWAEKFKAKGFTLSLIFFCLKSQEIARNRVKVRTEADGHFVNDSTIAFKWKEGYKNVNKHYSFFDEILIVDNSVTNEVYSNVLQIQNGIINFRTNKLPEYFERRFPSIYLSLKNSEQ